MSAMAFVAVPCASRHVELVRFDALDFLSNVRENG